MRITRVTTKTGDGGETSLGDGSKVSKDSLRIDVCGTVDELNSTLGVALAEGLDGEIAPWVEGVQNDLFLVGADVCRPSVEGKEAKACWVEERHLERLESQMGQLLKDLPPLEEFLLPGGARGAAHLHLARCVCRRAERLLVALSNREPVAPLLIRYMNRLSDWLFVVARRENRVKGVPEPRWKKDS